MIEELKKHLQSVGKTDESWLDLAKRFNILPNGTNKQRSDKVRKIWNSIKQEILKQRNTSNSFQTYYPLVPSEMYTYDFSTAGKPIQPVIRVERDNTDHQKDWEEFRKWKESKSIKKESNLPEPYLNGNPNNVLFIADIHEPFSKKGYLEHCRLQQEVFNCGTVIFAGDIVDNNFSSFHTIDPDGLSAGMELDQAIAKLQNWYKVFPQASVCLANHDRIIARKLFSAGVSKRWMKPLGEVFGVPNWKFVEQVIHNNVLYVHGEGGTATKKAQDELMSVCQGHLHTEGYVQLFNGGKNFAMQVGTGIDFEQYAFAYAQRGKKPILSCGIVHGSTAFLIPFNN